MTTEMNKQIGALTKLGVALAESFVKADTTANNTKRKALLSIAEKHLDKSRYEIVLDAYAKGLADNGMTANTVKIRKSEALQVLKAVDKTEVSEVNLKKLQEFEGTYNDFIALSRELVNEGKEVKTTTREHKKVELTVKQAETASELLHNANTSQLEGLISEAVQQVNAKSAPEMAGLKQMILISNIANTGLSNEAIEAPIQEALKAILAISEGQILAIQTAMKAADDAKNVAMQQEEAIL